jgi:hypothetical protein
MGRDDAEQQSGAERGQLEQKDEQLKQNDEQLKKQGEQLEHLGKQLQQKDEQLRQKDAAAEQEQPAAAASQSLPRDRAKQNRVVQKRPRPRPALLEQQRPAAVAAPPVPPPWRDAPAVLVDDATGEDARDCGVAPAPPCKTIHYAVMSRAIDGAVVTVRGGVYSNDCGTNGTKPAAGESLTIVGTGGRATVDCQGGGGAFFFNASRTAGAAPTPGAGPTLLLKNVAVHNASAAAGGGAVFAVGGGTVALEGCLFTDCEGRLGGAVQMTGGSGAQLSVSDSAFVRCSAVAGGGLFAEFYQPLVGLAAVTIDGSNFTDVAASHGGGGAYLVFAGKMTDTSVRVANTTFTNASAVARDGWMNNAAGGGLVVAYFGPAENAMTAIDGCAFTDTRANGGGGGASIEFSDATGTSVSVTSTTFTNSSVITGFGGGFCGGLEISYFSITNAAATSILDTTFTNCRADGIGGDSNGGGATLSYQGPSHAAAAVRVGRSRFEGNSAADGAGGGLAVNLVGNVTGASVDVLSSAFVGNSASGVGGGGGLSIEMPQDEPLNLMFVGNPDNGTWFNQSSGDGQGHAPGYGHDDDQYDIQQPLTPNLKDPCESCGVFPNGCTSCPQFQPANVDSFPVNPLKNVYRVWGGSNNTFTIRSSAFVNNTATYQGGAITVPGGGSGTVAGTLIEGNSATKFSGGGIFVGGNVDLQLVDATLRGNGCGLSGCQLSSSSGASITISSGSVIELGCGANGDCKVGFSAAQAGNATWDSGAHLACPVGYQLLNGSALGYRLSLKSWTLKPPSLFPPNCDLGSFNRKPGHKHPTPFTNSTCQVVKNNSNCACYFSENPYGGTHSAGFGPTPITPPVLVSTLSYACRACPTGCFNPTPATLGADNTVNTNGTIIGTCTPCPPGQYQDAMGQAVCMGCAANSHQPLAGQKTCVACPGGQFQPAQGQAGCLGTCPSGLDCKIGIARQLAGWWRPPGNLTSTMTLYECDQEGVCVGSDEHAACTGTQGESCLPPFNEQCARGYEGPVCALCAPDYQMQSNECRTCAQLEPQDAVGLTLLAAFLALCAFGYRKRNSVWLEPAILKIALGFYQLVSIMESSFTVRWPSAFQSAIQSIKLALAMVAELPSTTCYFHWDWFGRLYIWTFGMLAIALALWGRNSWRWYMRNESGTWAQLQQSLFYLAFFCYPLVAPVVVSIFDCRMVEGVSYLQADFTLLCAGGAYTLALVWSVLWTLCFVLGFPAVMTIALRKQYEASEFLAGDYKGGVWSRMWEVVDTVKKLLLSSAIIFLPASSSMRVGIALLISVTFQVLQAYHQPYKSEYKNRVADAAGAALSLTYFIGLLIEAQPSRGNSSLLGAVLVMLLLSVLLAAIGALVSLNRQAQSIRLPKKERRATAPRTEQLTRATRSDLDAPLLPSSAGHAHGVEV